MISYFYPIHDQGLVLKTTLYTKEYVKQHMGTSF